ncbi:MAG: electron transfer flavoprotein subunit alpha/FixB family protein [Firmicutes bacterium]|nr:electron transfer flavoprotein subunit alpha/FixB family protein [Bacillota bacterium]
MPNVVALVFAPAGQLPASAFELLGAGSRIAAAENVPLVAALVGSSLNDLPKQLLAHGAVEVYTVEDGLLETFQPDLYLLAAEQAVQAAQPQTVLLLHDGVGAELGPRLGARLKGGVVTDVIEIVTEGGVRYRRPVYGGKAMATYAVRRSPAVVTIRVRSQEPAPEQGNAEGPIHPVAVTLDPQAAKVKVVERIEEEEQEGVKLEDARVIVSGGRGLGKAENFQALKELADVLGAGMAASRAAVDAGWVPYAMQVGQTGKMVAPDLYIAVGISGASQHLAGITGSKHVVAINKDSEAPIFKRAELGVVDDYSKVLPVLTQKLKELLGK